MSYKRISVRFNMDVDAERKAWETIHEKGNGLVGKEVISAINTSSELSNLEKMIRKVVFGAIFSCPNDRWLQNGATLEWR